jgi:Domain of unknown function (DUF1707)/Domain of unknown function (DUF4190)
MTAGQSPWDRGHSPWDSQWDGTGWPPGGHYRASDADRDRVINVLKTAFTEGRLTKDEYDTRVGQVFSARTYADLGAVTGDLPVPRAPLVPRQDPNGLPRRPPRPASARTNSLARSALILGIVQILFPPLAIGAVVAGAKARRQIRQTGEAGYDRATWGLVLGWIGVMMLIISLTAGSNGLF